MNYRETSFNIKSPYSEIPLREYEKMHTVMLNDMSDEQQEFIIEALKAAGNSGLGVVVDIAEAFIHRGSVQRGLGLLKDASERMDPDSTIRFAIGEMPLAMVNGGYGLNSIHDNLPSVISTSDREIVSDIFAALIDRA